MFALHPFIKYLHVCRGMGIFVENNGNCIIDPGHRRPLLKDPDDDFLLDLAVESQADYIITYNQKDLQPSEIFGIKVVTPKQFLQAMGEIQ
ncbi:PIN domain-containing protein [Calothrix sp. NIES-3974]|uniref:PIN domain-containing protein n=1 Tax=Calothrix sp. NIES-3974 TaxID=2005462 RepID=UPI000B5E5A67|nr:PIN domain-containing protein [Calothrix sp. NIES-3974]BAZ07104.1 PilT protein domain protein [Calothrix sp. NIES-3974]